jgi:predicted RNA-binding Zn ribbon-like protein
MNRSSGKRRRRPARFELHGGVLCLDFVNTLDDRPSGKPNELVESYVDLAHFGEDTGILDPKQVDQLVEHSSASPEAARRALRDAIELREAIYAIVSAIVHKRPVLAMALATLNGYVQESAAHSRLVMNKGHFEWRLDESGADFNAPLWPIARSAAELLGSDRLGFVRACSSKTCQWLFLDTSKNRRRRWCSMKLCGNRTKVRRFYVRQKKAALS